MNELANGISKLLDSICAFIVIRCFNCRRYFPEASEEFQREIAIHGIDVSAAPGRSKGTKKSNSRTNLSVSSFGIESEVQKIARDIGFGIKANRGIAQELRVVGKAEW